MTAPAKLRRLVKPKRLVCVFWVDNGLDRMRVFTDLREAQNHLGWITDSVDSKGHLGFYKAEKS